MGAPPWAMVAGGLLGLDKLVFEPAGNIYKTVQGFRDDNNSYAAAEAIDNMNNWEEIQKYNPDGYMTYESRAKINEAKLKRIQQLQQLEADNKADQLEGGYPALVKYERGKQNGSPTQVATSTPGTEQAALYSQFPGLNAWSNTPAGSVLPEQQNYPEAVPVSIAPSDTQNTPAVIDGVDTSIYSQKTSNPILRKTLQDYLQRAKNESDLTTIASNTSQGNNAPADVLARFIVNGGDKGTTQINTLRELAKQNDEVAQRRGQQIYMNAVGKAKLGDSDGLNTLYAAAQYGMKPEDVAKTADTLGLVPKWETVETGTGQGEVKQRVRFNPRTGEEGARVGAPWMPSAPKVNMSVPVYVKAYESERGKLAAKDVDEMMQGAKAARSNINQLNAIEKLMMGIETGKLSPKRVTVAQFAKSFGITIDPKLGRKEAATALMNGLALQARNPAGGAGMPGAMSDKDRDFLVNMNPNLAQSSQGRQLIINIHKRLAKRKLEEASLAQDYINKNGMLDDGYYRQLDSWANQNPLFTQPARQSKQQSSGKRPPIGSFNRR